MTHNPLDLRPIGIFGAFRPFPDIREREEKGYLGYHVINKPEPEREAVTDRQEIGNICNEGGSLFIDKI